MSYPDGDSIEREGGTNHDPGMVPARGGGFRAADPWEMEQKALNQVNARIDFAPLYADEATRPIVHALVAAIGYVNGQSVNSAATITAALKVGLKALEKLQVEAQ